MTVPDGLARFLRTLLQMLAGGAFTALFDQVVRDVPTAYQPYLVVCFTLLVNAAQNYGEAQGWWPSLMKKQPAQVAPVVDQAA